MCTREGLDDEVVGRGLFIVSSQVRRRSVESMNRLIIKGSDKGSLWGVVKGAVLGTSLESIAGAAPLVEDAAEAGWAASPGALS